MLSLSNSASPALNNELEYDHVRLFSTVILKLGLMDAYALAGLPNKKLAATGVNNLGCKGRPFRDQSLMLD